MSKTRNVVLGLGIGAVVLVGGGVLGMVATGSFVTINPGEVGVVYDLRNGTLDDTLQQGFHIISPLQNVNKFNVSQEQLMLTSDKPSDVDEDDFENHHIDGVAKGGGAIKVNFQVQYKFDEERVPEIYQKFKGKTGEYIVEHYMSNKIISSTKAIIANYSVEELYPVTDKINEELKKQLDDELNSAYGIRIVEANIVKTTPTKEVMKKIDAKVQAKQEKEKAELDMATAEAQANTNKVKAEGEAAVAIEKAKGQAEANRVVSQSITKELIEMKNAEARLKHGWVEVQGADSVVVKGK